MSVDLRIPDVMGEIGGWRAWQIVGTLAVPRLMSVNAASRVGANDAIWPTNRWYYARCPKGHSSEIPVEACSCGLYAARDREHLIKLSYGAYGDSQLMAVGEVAFAGKVIQASQGYRAEKGRIKSLVVPYEFWAWADPLAAAYNVPVTVGFLFADADREDVFDKERRRMSLDSERRRLDNLANREEE